MPDRPHRRLRFERLEPRAMLAAVPVGAEFRVNTFTALDQERPSSAMDADGDFVVVWMSEQDGGAGTPGSYSGAYGIYAQRYNAAGVPQGSEFRVNTHTTGPQMDPAVAMDADGNFVVVWWGEGSGDTGGVFAQRYNAPGIAQGGEFRVNTLTTLAQFYPSVAMDADGDFVVAFSTDIFSGNNWHDVHAQRYNAAGVAQGGEFRVNTYTTNSQYEPVVAMDADGDFVVAWSSYGQDGSREGIYAQRYNESGAAQGMEFRVNTFTASNQGRDAAIDMDADGDFVVAWESLDQDGSSYGVYAKRYNASGIVQGGEFRVNTYTTNQQTNPSVGLDADGDFVVAWTSGPISGFGQDGSGYGAYAQSYSAAGAPIGAEFRVNTYTTGHQALPSLAMDSSGDFAVAWTSGNPGAPGQDGSGFGIFAQRYVSNLPPITSGIADVTVSENAPDAVIDLWAAFADPEQADNQLTYTVQANTSPWLFTSTAISAASGTLTLDFAPASAGTADITVLATDPFGAFVATTFTVTIEYPGDYNRDGIVDSGDYVVWRKTLGASGVPAYSGADGDGDSDVDQDDLAVWKAHFGNSPPQVRFAELETSAGPQLVLEVLGSHAPDTIMASSGAGPLDIAVSIQNTLGASIQRSFTTAEVEAAILASGLFFRGVHVQSRAGNDAIDLDSVELLTIVEAGDGGDDVTGGSAADPLLGGRGVDTISGGFGRDLVVGGRNGDDVSGNSADDILIGGEPVLDLAALDGALARWNDPAYPDYNDRVDYVLEDLVANENVLEDQAVDTLTGGSDQDLFFAAVDTPSNNDVLTDLDSVQEQVEITHPPIPASQLVGEAIGAVYTANDSSIDYVRIIFDPALWNGTTKDAVTVEIELVEQFLDGTTEHLLTLSLLLSATTLVSLNGGPGGTAVVDIDTTTIELTHLSRVNACVTLRGPGVLDGLAELSLETCVVLDPVRPS
jgi:hypothetical protein